MIYMPPQKKKRKTKKQVTKKKEKAKTENSEKQDIVAKILRLLKPTPNMLVGALLGAIISLLFLVCINPWILPLLAPRAELNIKVFQSHAPYSNGTDVWGILWNPRYAEYIVMIQLKDKSQPVEDAYLVFDFDAAILAVHEELIQGVTNPTIRIGGGALVVGDGEIKTDVKYTELIFDLEKLKHDGLCSFAVVIDPDYDGSLARSHIVPNPTSRYFGTYRYDAYGILVTKNVDGDIQPPRENES